MKVHQLSTSVTPASSPIDRNANAAAPELSCWKYCMQQPALYSVSRNSLSEGIAARVSAICWEKQAGSQASPPAQGLKEVRSPLDG